jgi:hypothetical protein
MRRRLKNNLQNGQMNDKVNTTLITYANLGQG